MHHYLEKNVENRNNNFASFFFILKENLEFIYKMTSTGVYEVPTYTADTNGEKNENLDDRMRTSHHYTPSNHQSFMSPKKWKIQLNV